MIKTLIATALLSGAIATPSIQKVFVSDRTLVGCYNLRNTYEIDFDEHFYFTLYFEDDIQAQGDFKQIVPFYRVDDQYNIWYCSSITFDVYSNYIEIYIFGYNYSISTPTQIYSGEFYNNSSLSNVDSNDGFYFDIREEYLVSTRVAEVFNTLFTHEDNIFTTTYTGYYNFNNGISSINMRFAVFGNFVFNTRMYDTMFNYGDGVHGDSNSVIYFGYYSAYYYEDGSIDGYSVQPITLPFDRKTITYANMMMTNCKMSKQSYNRLSNVGVFAYQRDTSYDNASFEDLLFGIMDSPIYMISRLLSFELFGVNLFVALTGLLTILIIVLLIKRFA